MTLKPKSPKASASVRKQKTEKELRSAALLTILHQSSATKGFALPRVTLAKTPPGQIQQVAVELFQKTGDVLWLWVAIDRCKGQDDIPPQAFTYILQIAHQFSGAIKKNVRSLERVQTMPGGATFRNNDATPAQSDVLRILGLSHPGRNAFQAVARQLRDMSIALAVESQALNEGLSRSKIQTRLARDIGEKSAAAGLAAASIKQMVARGKKLAFSILHPKA